MPDMHSAPLMALAPTLVLASALVLGPAPARGQIGGCTPDPSGALVYAIETPLGDIPVELHPNTAPLTVANFQAYADAGDWDGSIVHRSDPGFVIQGGGFRHGVGGYEGVPTDPPVPNEACLSNTAGTLAMARLSGQPNSATSQWFINLGDNSFLDGVDGGFTAFGRVVGDGMEVAQAIASLPRLPWSDALATLELPHNHAFSELPLFALPADPPGGYGCSRSAPVFGLSDGNAPPAFIADPARTASKLVPILLDPQCTGAGAGGPPSVPCDASGRVVYQIDLVNQIYFEPPHVMSCAAVAESEESWAARRAGTLAQLLEEDVLVTSVPEPTSTWLRAAGVLALHALVARRRRAGRA